MHRYRGGVDELERGVALKLALAETLDHRLAVALHSDVVAEFYDKTPDDFWRADGAGVALMEIKRCEHPPAIALDVFCF